MKFATVRLSTSVDIRPLAGAWVAELIYVSFSKSRPDKKMKFPWKIFTRVTQRVKRIKRVKITSHFLFWKSLWSKSAMNPKIKNNLYLIPHGAS